MPVAPTTSTVPREPMAARACRGNQEAIPGLRPPAMLTGSAPAGMGSCMAVGTAMRWARVPYGGST